MRDITPEERAAAAARRLALAPGRAAGVTEAVIQAQVHAFYGKVRTDPMLGPIFEAKIADWDAHLAKLCDFWSSVTLATGRFKGAPMPAHMRLTGVGAQHFAHWLDIWRAPAAPQPPPPPPPKRPGRDDRPESADGDGGGAGRAAAGALSAGRPGPGRPCPGHPGR